MESATAWSPQTFAAFGTLLLGLILAVIGMSLHVGREDRRVTEKLEAALRALGEKLDSRLDRDSAQEQTARHDANNRHFVAMAALEQRVKGLEGIVVSRAEIDAKVEKCEGRSREDVNRLGQQVGALGGKIDQMMERLGTVQTQLARIAPQAGAQA